MRAFGGRILVSAFVLASACSKDEEPSEDDEAAEDSGAELPPLPEGHARVNHSFGVVDLAALEETEPCIQWTLQNEQPIYVNKLVLTNNGGFHHSNWFVVPDWLFPSPDGFVDCDAIGFTEIEAAVSGSVLFAQSTQSRYDELTLPDSVVVKIPPHHKIIAGGHLLNLANAPYRTELRMNLEIVHPREVQVVVAPFRLTYYDLHLPPFTESRFTSTCDLDTLYQDNVDVPLDIKLYFVIPHFHYLGNFFDLTISGGPRDGESVFRMEGFNADSNGRAYNPPIDMTGATGFTFTCGYDNWRDKDIGWGIGDQEMCVMLGLADSKVLMDATAAEGNETIDVIDGVHYNEAPCRVIGLPKHEDQTLPTPEEIAGELYVPPTDPNDADLPPVPTCASTPDDAVADGPATLSGIAETVFVSSCVFSSCHQGEAAVRGLDLASADLHTELMNHDVQADTTAPLVKPGDAEGSYLYQLISDCTPEDRSGNAVNHMPLNAPFLLDPGLVARVRDWIEAGAKND